MKKKKIIFFINTYTSYQDDFFKVLKKYFEVRVVFFSEIYKNYNFNIYKSINKNYYFLNNFDNQHSKLFDIIYKFNSDFYVFGGYRLPFTSKIISYIGLKKKKYYFWLERLNKNNFLKFYIVRYLISKKIKKANGILSVGKEASKFYKSFNKKILNLPYSVSINSSYKKEYFYNNKINFLFVGQLIKRKGIDIILKTFASLGYFEKKLITLTIIGNGKYKKKINQFKIQNNFVNHLDFLNKKKLSLIYKKTDVFLFPSRFDGWGVAPLEAMSYSSATIISKYTGMKEIINYNKKKITSNLSVKDLLAKINNLIKKKIEIKKNGKRNYKILKNSVCNNKISAKRLHNFLKKN